VKILAVLQNPGYLRHYGGVLVELGRRGHDVRVSFTDEMPMREGLRALEEAPVPIPTVKDVPKRRDFWQPFALGVRNTAAYVRYLDPRLEARYVRDRLDRLPRSLRPLRRVERLPRSLVGTLLRALIAVEQAVPPNAGHEEWLRQVAPDVVFVSPIVQDLAQADVFKAARSLGIPSVLGVASWDHLTTKGLVTVRPESVLVWNHAQREELRDLHLLRDGVVVTGSQTFDPWFGRAPSRDRAAFCADLGLPTERPYALYVGSFRSIADARAEQRFVHEWLAALRSDPRLADLAVLVRPHPYNSDGWDSADFAGYGDVVVWSHAAYPVHEAARDAYFDSLHHSSAVVGINTSAMLEAAIVGRPVLTIRAAEFADTQAATVHFRYLDAAAGGFLRVSSSLPDHLDQLAAARDGGVLDDEQRLRFVESFVRPHGLDAACTPIVAAAVEATAERELRPVVDRQLLRVALVPIAALSWVTNPKARKRAVKRGRRPLREAKRAARRVYRRSRRLARRGMQMFVRRGYAIAVGSRRAALRRDSAETREERR
jgi:hypothetical protein